MRHNQVQPAGQHTKRQNAWLGVSFGLLACLLTAVLALMVGWRLNSTSQPWRGAWHLAWHDTTASSLAFDNAVFNTSPAPTRLHGARVQLAQIKLPPLPPAKKTANNTEQEASPRAVPPKKTNPYSQWVQLSLRGYSQEEIEARLAEISPKEIKQVKQRLRNRVMSNLKLRQAKKRLKNSLDVDDVNVVLGWVRLELRFAGMQNDALLREMIRNHLEISFL